MNLQGSSSGCDHSSDPMQIEGDLTGEGEFDLGCDGGKGIRRQSEFDNGMGVESLSDFGNLGKVWRRKLEFQIPFFHHRLKTLSLLLDLGFGRRSEDRERCTALGTRTRTRTTRVNGEARERESCVEAPKNQAKFREITTTALASLARLENIPAPIWGLWAPLISFLLTTPCRIAFI